MAVTGDTFLTLKDVASRFSTDPNIKSIVEILSQTNQILEDMHFVKGNLPTGHKTTIRTGLPAVAWRLLNYGVPQSKSRTQQIIDSCGMLEAYSDIDKSLADLNGNTGNFRLSEDRAFLQAMNHEMASTLFYGDTGKNPERFLGLSPRYSSLNPKVATSENVLDAGGTAAGGLTSVWLISWGANTVHGIYPSGSNTGVHQNDLGEVTLHDASGGQYQGYRTHYKWDIGLVVRDWRYAVRVANIDLKTIADDDLITLLIQAASKLPDENSGRPVWYMNREMRTRVRLAKVNRPNNNVTFDTVEGKPLMRFDEFPVKRCDALLSTEARVVA